jgi:hypothetical protein
MTINMGIRFSPKKVCVCLVVHFFGFLPDDCKSDCNQKKKGCMSNNALTLFKLHFGAWLEALSLFGQLFLMPMLVPAVCVRADGLSCQLA